MQSAAGGTSQRLKPAVAIVRSLSRRPGAPDGTNVVSAAVIGIHLQVRDLEATFSKIGTLDWEAASFVGRFRSEPRRFHRVHRIARRTRPTGILIDARLSGDAL